MLGLDDFQYVGSFRLPEKVADSGAGYSEIGIALRTYLGWSNDRFPYASAMPSITGALPLDDDDFPAELRQPYRADVSGRPGTDDDSIDLAHFTHVETRSSKPE